jgi:predicted dehydrogenase
MFIEKPVGADVETLRKVRAGIQRKKLITAVGYQDRYLDIVERMKKFLDGRGVGMIKGYWMGGMPGVMWWRQKKLSGGQHVEQTTHTFDMARYLFGDVKRVAAVASKGLMTEHEKYDIQDASAVHLEFASGLVGTIFSACFLQAGGGKVGIDIYGKDFYIEYQGRRSISINRKNKTEVFRNTNNSTLIEDQTFIDAVLSGDGSKIRSPYADAAKSAAVSIAASDSLKSGNFEKVKL